MIEIRIQDPIFETFPDFRRGIVVAENMNNTGGSAELEEILTQAVDQAGQNPIDLKTDPRILVWSDAHRRFRSNPNKFPPAHLALLKRVQKPGARIPFINKVVAIMNDNSIRAAMPVGGDDLNQAGRVLELCFATGSEHFAPLNDPEKMETPDQGEIVYLDSETNQVMCRRWNWRNGYHTRVTENTKAMVMNIDALGPDSESKAAAVRDRVASMLEEYCRATVTTALLTPTQPFYHIK